MGGHYWRCWRCGIVRRAGLLSFRQIIWIDLITVQIAHLCGYKVLAACSPSAIKVNISSPIL